MKNHRTDRAAFTLLEVMLGLMLTAVLLGALTMAIQVTLRATATGRGDVEQAQLARSLMRRILDDLHSAVVYEPQDITGMLVPSASLASGTGTSIGTSGQNGGSGGQNGGAQGGGQNGGGQGGNPPGGPPMGSGTSSNSSSGSSGATSVTGTTQLTPALYGMRDWLEFELARLPRGDEYSGQGEDATRMSGDGIVSDLKTVTYFVANGSGSQQMGGSISSLNSSATGLVRQEVDRAANAWATENGGVLNANTNINPLAPEVVALQFGYFDGTEWLVEWDSAEMKSLPLAIRVAIVLAEPAAIDANYNFQNDDLFADWVDLPKGCSRYQLTAVIPVARPPEPENIAGGETSADGSGASNSGGNNSSAGGGNGGGANGGGGGGGGGANGGGGGGRQ